jgi:[calcium/calmodulin-dependent protein kinase] kinase
VALDDGFSADSTQKRVERFETSLNHNISEDYAGYDGDHVMESGDDQDDSDDDDFIIMTRGSGIKRSESIANGVLARSAGQASSLSRRRRSTRSGSNGTVKKIRPDQTDGDDDQRQQSPETTSQTL